MKTIVIYSSKTGFSQKYAQWIAEDLECKAVSIKDMPKDINTYDCIIFGGGIMAGKISGLDKIKKNATISGKKLLVYATGATFADATEAIQGVRDGNLTAEEQEKIPFYYFQGGMNFEKMGFVQKTMIKTLKGMLEKKENKTDEEIGMLSTFQKSEDHSDKAYIQPLIEYVKGLTQ